MILYFLFIVLMRDQHYHSTWSLWVPSLSLHYAQADREIANLWWILPRILAEKSLQNVIFDKFPQFSMPQKFSTRLVIIKHDTTYERQAIYHNTMRIIVPKGTPRQGASSASNTSNSTNNNNISPSNEPARTIPPTDPTSFTPNNNLPNSHNNRNPYGIRTSPPHEFSSSYAHEPGEIPRRRKQTKKHKSTSPSNTTASYYNNADLDDGYNSSDEHGSKPAPQQSGSCGQGLIQEVLPFYHLIIIHIYFTHIYYKVTCVTVTSHICQFGKRVSRVLIQMK